MDARSDCQQPPAILYVDDEEKALKNFVRGFGDEFRVFTAANAKDGLALLDQHHASIGLLMTDQRMPGENGVWLLEHARRKYPGIVRVLATAYSDYEVAIAAVNNGSIYKFINKPFDPAQLEQTLKRGLELFALQRERDDLLKEKLSILHNMMIADRLVSLGLLAAGLSHHIRNSLQAVRTFLDLAPAKLQEEKTLAEGLRDPDFWKSYYQLAQGQITRIQELLSDLWSAAENPRGQFADLVDLPAAVAGAVSRLTPELGAKQITVNSELAASLPPIHADGPKIHRLFDLLLRDELVSLPAGSQISIRAEPAEHAGKPGVTLVFEDNGPGLPPETLRTLFDPFLVRGDSPAEYGINLMACFFIVYHHGGTIGAESEVGKGTRFTIRLPLQPDRAVPLANDRDFLQKAVLNEQLWQRLISG
jgi:two-component system probable response regulator PhcQ